LSPSSASSSSSSLSSSFLLSATGAGADEVDGDAVYSLLLSQIFICGLLLIVAGM